MQSLKWSGVKQVDYLFPNLIITLNILLLSATVFEILPTIQFLEKSNEIESLSQFSYRSNLIFPLVGGVGSPMMSFALGRAELKNIQLIIHAGLSGSLNKEIELCSLVEVVSEYWADLGAEEKDGSFLDLFQLGLLESKQFPFEDGCIKIKDSPIRLNIPKVKGLTLNTVSGMKENIAKLKMRVNADVESMEGAAVFYGCKMRDIPFISIRSISNYVEPRDKSKWKIPESIDLLNDKILEIIKTV